MAGKQDGPGPIIYGPPRASRIAKNAHFCILWPIYEKLAVNFSPCYTYRICHNRRALRDSTESTIIIWYIYLSIINCV